MMRDIFNAKNSDQNTVSGFGDEWERFNQSKLDSSEQQNLYNRYFDIFPFHLLPQNPVGFDMGCGSGRWAKLMAGHVKGLYCIDPSSALEVARSNLKDIDNCRFISGGVGDSLLPENSMDFGYSLGVLHHVPDTQRGIDECVSFLKPGAPFLLYLYYSFDNRNFIYKILWVISDYIRIVVSRMPFPVRYFLSQFIAALIYYPMARFSLLLSTLKFRKSFIDMLPLASYRNLSFYTMRTDALDRFGTQLEQRFSKSQIKLMMEKSGLVNIKFSDRIPYWCAVGIKAVK